MLQSRTNDELLSLSRTVKHLVSEIHDRQLMDLNVLNTICEISQYENFVSLDEQKAFAFVEAENHVLVKKNAAIIKHMNDQKSKKITHE